MTVVNHDAVGEAILAIDSWLDTMRCPGGYGGPVVHWWRDSLIYAGPGLDWRYEGIISGYLNLYQRTGQSLWLTKARRAGDDLVQGQMPDGTFCNSSFEANPQSGGTPHEAACDLGLLRLAHALRIEQDPAWQIYAAAAGHNLEAFIVGTLWNGKNQNLRNMAFDDSFVPNKAATTVEALLAWAEMTSDNAWVGPIVLPVLDGILAAQVQDSRSPVDGAIAQSTSAHDVNRRYFPYYIARCIPALLQGSILTADARYLQAAQHAMDFILRVRLEDGSLPQVVYDDGRRVNRYPQWIAALGDVLRAMDLMTGHGMVIDTEPTMRWLLRGRQSSASLRTAHGFSSQVSQAHPSTLPDFRDLVGVCGWVDKAFHYLTGLPASIGVAEAWEHLSRIAMPCRFDKQPAMFREDEASITVRRGNIIVYRWRKGTTWAKLSA